MHKKEHMTDHIYLGYARYEYSAIGDLLQRPRRTATHLLEKQLDHKQVRLTCDKRDHLDWTRGRCHKVGGST